MDRDAVAGRGYLHGSVRERGCDEGLIAVNDGRCVRLTGYRGFPTQSFSGRHIRRMAEEDRRVERARMSQTYLHACVAPSGA
jgi:hypothetical protein